MPIYEYKCNDCGKVSEIMVGINVQDDTLQCKYCGSTSLKKTPTFASISMGSTRPRGRTCCGREERCDKPPCSTDGSCYKD